MTWPGARSREITNSTPRNNVVVIRVSHDLRPAAVYVPVNHQGKLAINFDKRKVMSVNNDFIDMRSDDIGPVKRLCRLESSE